MADGISGWVKSTFGVDPESYLVKAESAVASAGETVISTAQQVGEAAVATAEQTGEAVTREAKAVGGAMADGAKAAGRALGGAYDAAAFKAKHKLAESDVKKASGRVVPLGPPTDAKNQLNGLIGEMDAASKAGNYATALQKLEAAKAKAKIVLDAPDPAMQTPVAGTEPNTALYGKEKLPPNTGPNAPRDKTDVADTDINQGTIGDCYVLSTIGEIARIKPQLIKDMIHDNGDGTYTVTLHKQKTGMGYLYGKITGQEYEDVKVTVDGHFGSGGVNSLSDQGEKTTVEGGKHEIWVQVLEKAYAKLHGGYDKIADGGNADEVMGELTGKKGTARSPKSVKVEELEADLASGKPVVVGTPEEDDATTPFGLVGGHDYMLESIRTDPKTGKKFVKLRNPWGKDQPSEMPFDEMQKVTDEIDEGAAL